ncbi:MAG: peptide chain release factor 1 [Candidatus Cloacimonetes bacterium]|nr:peptide chain release factor 1 [Candidatus Cloacimonadota bacterium]
MTNLLNKVTVLRQEYSDLEKQLADPAIITQLDRYKKIAARYKEISEILQCAGELNKNIEALNENKESLKHEDEEELVLLIEEENANLESNVENLTQKLKTMLIPKDENDEKIAIMEIRAGTGGDEAALFVADLYRMYTHFIENKGWKIDIMNSNPTGMGGLKEISFEVQGKNAYGTLKFESGVHRVQRVPETESSGRIHTSAASVVVLAEAEEIDFNIDENDLKIDVYRSSGPGGQSVNTTDSAVRITHVPTGTVVTCQDEKSQLKNKHKAMKVLRSRLLDQEIQKQQQSIARQRRSMVGTGDRSAKIRTYNYPQSRITDHRINYTSHNLESFMDGNIDELIDALHIAMQEEMLCNE